MGQPTHLLPLLSMKIKTLEHTPFPELVITFNEAFSDYIIPFQLDEAALIRRFKSDNIDLSLSPGYFVGGKLCGFIFHFVSEKEGSPIVWNGGTGVVPDQRGQSITTQLYDFILPVLRNKGFDQNILEVIEGNDPAVHTYLKNGFSIIRKLDCYKGEMIKTKPPERIHLKKIETINWPTFHFFRSWQPSFQNNDPKLNRFRAELEVIGAYDQNKLVGYIIFVKKAEAGDVYQFAVNENYRRRGIGRALFARAAEGKTVPLKIINVDAGHEASKAFFEKTGFEKTVSQFEMIKQL